MKIKGGWGQRGGPALPRHTKIVLEMDRYTDGQGNNDLEQMKEIVITICIEHLSGGIGLNALQILPLLFPMCIFILVLFVHEWAWGQAQAP